MARPYQILLPLLCLFLVRVDLTDLFPLRLSGKLLKIYDGDTVLVRRERQLYKIRLARIDAPEKGQPFLSGKGDAGMVAKTCLEKIVKPGESVKFEFYKRDIYGRYLGDLGDLSFKLIQNGCVTIYPHAEFRSVQEKFRYLIALKKAKQLRQGIWMRGGIRQPMLWRKANRRIARRR